MRAYFHKVVIARDLQRKPNLHPNHPRVLVVKPHVPELITDVDLALGSTAGKLVLVEIKECKGFSEQGYCSRQEIVSKIQEKELLERSE